MNFSLAQNTDDEISIILNCHSNSKCFNKDIINSEDNLVGLLRVIEHYDEEVISEKAIKAYGNYLVANESDSDLVKLKAEYALFKILSKCVLGDYRNVDLEKQILSTIGRQEDFYWGSSPNGLLDHIAKESYLCVGKKTNKNHLYMKSKKYQKNV